MQDLECDVLVVGAGPVGLTLAMDLVARGAKVVIAEIRRYAEPPNVKCNHVSARTMERFRKLGVARKLRDAGLPPDYPNDVVFRTSVRGEELTRRRGLEQHWQREGQFLGSSLTRAVSSGRCAGILSGLSGARGCRARDD